VPRAKPGPVSRTRARTGHDVPASAQPSEATVAGGTLPLLSADVNELAHERWPVLPSVQGQHCGHSHLLSNVKMTPAASTRMVTGHSRGLRSPLRLGLPPVSVTRPDRAGRSHRADDPAHLQPGLRVRPVGGASAREPYVPALRRARSRPKGSSVLGGSARSRASTLGSRIGRDAIRDLSGGRGVSKSLETSGASTAARAALEVLDLWGSACWVDIGSTINFEVTELLYRQITAMTSWTCPSPRWKSAHGSSSIVGSTTMLLFTER
jgi:hypothetical protein